MHGQLERAGRLAREGVQRACEAEGQLIYTAELYWLAARVQADRALRAQTMGDCFEARKATQQAEAVAAKLRRAICGYGGDGAPPEALAFELLVRAELGRGSGGAVAGILRAPVGGVCRLPEGVRRPVPASAEGRAAAASRPA